MQITQQQLGACIGNNPYLEQWTDALNKILPDYGIDTPQRVAAFVAQSAHESGNFTALHENLNYKAESLCKVWPKYFNAGNANDYAHNPEKIANRVYSNRMGNGDEESGDGYKFRGRGFIQITGRDNYTGFSKDNGMSVDEAVEYMETPEGACMSAGWFWNKHGLNGFADRNDCRGATVRINGGTIGLEEREEIYKEALELFS